MFKIRFNIRRSLIFSTVFGISLLIVSLFVICLPSHAGPQSLLDPYADVQVTNVKPSVKSLTKRIVKQPARQTESSEQEASSGTAESNLASPLAESSGKTKKPGKTKFDKENNAGFLSGVKEIQHGYVTSIKAAGSGLVNGSKLAGTKVTIGTKALRSRVAAASSKIISGPKDLVARTHITAKARATTPAVSTEALSAQPKIPTLPGKPLDQVIAQEKEHKRLKDVAVTGGTYKPGPITAVISKLNFFHKTKKGPAVNVTANNPQTAVR